LKKYRPKSVAAPYRETALFAKTSELGHDMPRQLVVIEHAANSKKDGTQVLGNSCHLSHTLDSNFLGSSVRRRDQDLNPNICSNRWAFAAQYQGAVQGDVGGEAPSGVLNPVVPMEDNGQPQLVSHSCSALEDWTWGHGRAQSKQVPKAPQDGERWEINEPTEVPQQRRFLYKWGEEAGSSSVFQRNRPAGK
jgi:hypothetical protein